MISKKMRESCSILHIEHKMEFESLIAFLSIF